LEDQDGKKHYRTELVANEMIMLGERKVAEAAEEAGWDEAEFERSEFPF